MFFISLSQPIVKFSLRLPSPFDIHMHRYPPYKTVHHPEALKWQLTILETCDEPLSFRTP